MVNNDVDAETVREEGVPFVKAVVNEVRDEDVPFMAGSIAYQAFISLIPLLVLAFFVVSLIGDEQLARDVVEFARGFLPEEAADLLGDSIAGQAGSAGSSFIGLVTLIWGTLKVFRGLDTAFSEIYDTMGRNSFVNQVVDGFVMLVAIGGAILAAGAAVTVVSFVPLPGDGVVVPLVLVGALGIAFYPMYSRFPDMDVSRWEIVPGVVIAALGWTALQVLFQFYVEIAGQSGGAGVVGAVILLLTWLYFGGFVLLLGGVVNAVIAGRRGDAPLADPIDDGGDERTAAEDTEEESAESLSKRLEIERDRRRKAERERDRLHRELERTRDSNPDGRELRELRERNRRLRRRLRWERRSLPARAVWRLLGREPPSASRR